MLFGSCLTLDFWFRVCVAIIIAIALWRLLMLFLPILENRLPWPIPQIINIIVWALIAVLCLVVLFFFISCLWGLVSSTFGGAHFRSGWIIGPAAMSYYDSKRFWRLSTSGQEQAISG